MADDGLWVPDRARRDIEENPPKPAPGPAVAQRRVEKVGRNEPCPCGSGRKYKRCCGG